MKKIITILFLGLTLTTFAQDKELLNELSYCGQIFKAPENCSSNSKYELSCDNYSIQWLYMNEQMLSYMPQQFIQQLEQKLKKTKKERIRCISFETEIEGYKISYKDGKQKKYKIIAFGNINNQPVLINLSLKENPTDNEKIPEFVQQIIKLKK